MDVDYDEFNRVERVDGILTAGTDPDTVLWTWNASTSQLNNPPALTLR